MVWWLLLDAALLVLVFVLARRYRGALWRLEEEEREKQRALERLHEALEGRRRV